MFICKTLSSVNAANVNAFFQQIHTYASNISTMGVASDVFRESLAHVEARIAEELAKKKELERKRAEGEVGYITFFLFTTLSTMILLRQKLYCLMGLTISLHCYYVENGLLRYKPWAWPW